MLNLCPGCAGTVNDADEVCPFCRRDFRLPSRPARRGPSSPRAAAIEPDSPPCGKKISTEPAASPSRSALRWATLAALVALAVAARRHSPLSALQGPVPAAPARAEAPAAPAEALRDSPAEAAPRLAAAFPEPAPPPKHRRLIRPASPRGRARFYGSVVDVLSLEPVSGARLEFVDLASGRRYNATTDWTGAYDVDLPPSAEGYALLFSRDGYGPGYAESDSEAIQATGEDARRRMAEEIASAARARDPFAALPGERTRYDFAVVPQRG